MKQFNYQLLLCLISGLIAGQLFAQRDALATGGEASGVDGTMSYSVGLIDYTQIAGSGGTMNLGMQQTFDIVILDGEEIENIDLKVIVFPNPTISNVTLFIKDQINQDLFYTLHDLNGRLIHQNRIISNESIIPMEMLSSSTYFLNVMDERSVIKSFKLIKN